MSDALAGYTKLMLLIEEEDIEGINELLAKGTDLNARNKSGQTALTIASKNGSTAIVAKLLAHGAEINIRNKFGQTALFTACSQNFEDIVMLLIDHRADVNIKDSRGWTPLMISCYHGHSNIVKILLDQGADILVEDSFGKTAITRTKSPEIQQLLSYYANKELQSYSAVNPSPLDMQQPAQKRKEERNRGLSLQTPVAQNHPSLNRSSKGSLVPGSDASLQKSPRVRDSSKTGKSPIEKFNKETHPYSYKNMKKMLDADSRRADQNVQPPIVQREEVLVKKKEEQRQKEQRQKEQITQTRQQKRGASSHRSRVESLSPKPEEGRFQLKSPEGFERSQQTQFQQKTMLVGVQSPAMSYADLSNSKKTFKSPTNEAVPKRHPLKESNLAIEQIITEDYKKVATPQQQPHGFPKKPQVSSKTKLNQEQFEQAVNLKSKAHYHQELKTDISAAEVKTLLSNYVGSYSELIQTYIRQKLSYALAFEMRRIFTSVKQEFTVSLLQNTITLQKDLMESLVSIAERTNVGALGRNLEDLKNDITSIIEAFESQMLPASEEQDLLGSMYQRSQEIDSSLVREVDARYTREEEACNNDFERDVFRFLKLEMNLQVGNAASSINEILYQEFGSGDENLKLLVHDSLKSVLGEVSSSLKRNLIANFPFDNESEESRHSTQVQDESRNCEHQQQENYNTQHVGFVFVNDTALQPLDANKRSLREDEEMPHEKKGKKKGGSPKSSKAHQDIVNLTAQFTEKQFLYANDSNNSSCKNNPAKTRSSPIEIIDSRDQNMLLKEESSPQNKTASEKDKENIELGEGHVSHNNELVNSIDRLLAKKAERKAEPDQKQFQNLYNNYLINEATPNDEKLNYRKLERQQAQEQNTEKSRAENHKEEKESQPATRNQKQEEIISVYRRNEKALIENCAAEKQKRSLKEMPNELKRAEDSKAQMEDSCELTATEGSINASLENLLNKSKEKPNNQDMFILEIAKPDNNHPSHLANEEIEKPYELTVRGEEQKEEEKINYLIQKIGQDDSISEIEKDQQHIYPSGSTTPFASDTNFMRDSHTSENQPNRNPLPETISAFVESKLDSGISTKKETLRIPELPKPTSNLIKNKKIMKDLTPVMSFSRIVTTTSELEVPNQSTKTDYFATMTQSMAFETNPLQKSFGVSKLDPMQFSRIQSNPDTSGLSLASSGSRKVLTNSLIVENQKLSQDVNSAIQRSKRIHLEYLAAKEQELKNSRIEERQAGNREFSRGV